MELTISTESYGKELMDWINDNNYGHIEYNMDQAGGGLVVTINRTRGLSENMALLFEEIILRENQVAGAHEKLKDVIRNIVFETGRKEIQAIFDDYIDESDHINLEGFVAFRLGEYTSLINIVLYAAVKKILY